MHKDRIVGGVENTAIVLFRFFQFFGRTLIIGNIAKRADHTYSVAGFIQQKRVVHQRKKNTPVTAGVPDFTIEPTGFP
jgi:hypothetical protein